MGALANYETRLAADVANAGTVTVPAYPSGSSQATLNGTTGGEVVIGDSDRWKQGASPGVGLTYGSSTITITNNSGVTWPAGRKLVASFGRTDRNGSYNLVLGDTADTAKRGNA